MKKMILLLALMTGSFAAYSQMDEPMESRLEANMPDMGAGSLSEMKWSAGVTSGVNSPKGPSTTSAEYGLIVGFQPVSFITSGIEANTTRLDNDNDIRQTTALIRTAYNIGGDIPVLRNSFVGAGVGPVFISNKVRWAGAPLVGFDIPLNQRSNDYLSLGLEAKYLFITDTDVPDLFASALALKYWF